MALQPGTRLGPYEILAAIGAGGMGDVYRARDGRLNRDVAIKVLPELSAADADSVARFEREAQTLAALNHPNIAIIHGFEESTPTPGSGQPIRALVLELVEGPTLAERNEKGRLPLDEALPIARQIAEACEAAHAQGIVHRDLKPANIKLRPDGTVKILDFGIAKLVDPVGGGGPSVRTDGGAEGATLQRVRSVRRPDVTSAQTLATPMTTMAGTILGTAAYMSPEQARGKSIDKRADIWAFGCVLFEMLTGARAFGGDTVTDTLAFVITKELDWSALPPNTPDGIERLLRRCLAKEPTERLRDIGDARIEIKEALASPAVDGAASPIAAAPFGSWPRLGGIAALVAVAATLSGALVWLRMRPSPARVSRFGVSPSAAAGMLFSRIDRDIAISPDGNRIAYIGNGGTIYVRALDQLEPSALVGLGAPRGVFFSPNGQWIAFFDAGALKKVAVTGGPAVVICRVAAGSRGAVWLPDDTIVFATNEVSDGLRSVPAGRGEPASLSKPNRERGEASYAWPEAVTGRRAVLFTIASTTTPAIDNSQIAIFDLKTGTQKVLLRGGSDAHYLPSGYLVYGAGGVLRAVRFDVDRLEVLGNPVAVLPQVAITQFGAVDFDVANDGAILLYVPGGAQEAARSIVWVDREGREEPTKVPQRGFAYARLSPDGAQLALDARDQESDIWIWNFGRETLTRLTFDPATDRFPVWTSDGRRVMFGSDRQNAAGLANVFSQSADGTGHAERLTTSVSLQVPMTVSPDGRTLVFRETSSTADLMTLSLDAEHTIRPLLQTIFIEQNAEISPDGRWMAYESNESGQFEVFVRPFPNVDAGRWQISTTGGVQPLWSRSGQELFYLVAGGGLMGVHVERGASWSAGAPRKVFDERYYHGSGPNSGTGRTYDISPDGRRFLMIKQGESSGAAPGRFLKCRDSDHQHDHGRLAAFMNGR